MRSNFATDVWLVRDAFRELRLAIPGMGIVVELHCGGELGPDLVGRLEQAELEAIALGPPGHRWLLVEAPFDGLDEEFTAATDELRERGFGIVIAHPERAVGLLEDSWPALRRELAAGSRLQVNHWSLTGAHGAAAEEAALALLDCGLVAALASDAHPGWRRPTLSLGASAAQAAGVDERSALALIADGPWSLLRSGVRPRVPALS